MSKKDFEAHKQAYQSYMKSKDYARARTELIHCVKASRDKKEKDFFLQKLHSLNKIILVHLTESCKKNLKQGNTEKAKNILKKCVQFTKGTKEELFYQSQLAALEKTDSTPSVAEAGLATIAAKEKTEDLHPPQNYYRGHSKHKKTRKLSVISLLLFLFLAASAYFFLLPIIKEKLNFSSQKKQFTAAKRHTEVKEKPLKMKKEFFSVTPILNEIEINGKTIRGKTKGNQNSEWIKTGPNAEALIQIEKSEIYLEKNTEIKIKKFEKNKHRVNIRLNLKKGSALFKVKKRSAKDEYHVTTPSITAGVRGTKFIIKAEKDRAVLSCKEGKVDVYSKAMRRRILIRHGYEIAIPAQPIYLLPVLLSEETEAEFEALEKKIEAAKKTKLTRSTEKSKKQEEEKHTENKIKEKDSRFEEKELPTEEPIADQEEEHQTGSFFAPPPSSHNKTDEGKNEEDITPPSKKAPEENRESLPSKARRQGMMKPLKELKPIQIPKTPREIKKSSLKTNKKTSPDIYQYAKSRYEKKFGRSGEKKLLKDIHRYEAGKGKIRKELREERDKLTDFQKKSYEDIQRKFGQQEIDRKSSQY